MSNNNITYTLSESGYYIPNLVAPEWKPIGKYGRLHLRYIKAHRKSLYSTLMITGELNDYLVAIDEQADKMYLTLMQKYAEQYAITEQLKATNQMEWVRLMNYVHHQVNEVILSELIYV